MLSYWRSAILLAMFVSIYNMVVLILVPTLLLKVMFSICDSKYLAMVEMILSCSTIFDENMVILPQRYLLSCSMLYVEVKILFISP